MLAPTSKTAVRRRRSASQAMACMQTRLHDLSIRCDHFQAKYSVPNEATLTGSPTRVTLRSWATHRDDSPARTSHIAACRCLHAAKACQSGSTVSSKQEQACSHMQQCSIANSVQKDSHADDWHKTAAASTSQPCAQTEKPRLQPSKQCRGAKHASSECQTVRSPIVSAFVSGCQVLSSHQGLSHRQVLQQGILQLQQQLLRERDDMLEQRMQAARRLFSDARPCRCY